MSEVEFDEVRREEKGQCESLKNSCRTIFTLKFIFKPANKWQLDCESRQVRVKVKRVCWRSQTLATIIYLETVVELELKCRAEEEKRRKLILFRLGGKEGNGYKDWLRANSLFANR